MKLGKKEEKRELTGYGKGYHLGEGPGGGGGGVFKMEKIKTP